MQKSTNRSTTTGHTQAQNSRKAKHTNEIKQQRLGEDCNCGRAAISLYKTNVLKLKRVASFEQLR